MSNQVEFCEEQAHAEISLWPGGRRSRKKRERKTQACAPHGNAAIVPLCFSILAASLHFLSIVTAGLVARVLDRFVDAQIDKAGAISSLRLSGRALAHDRLSIGASRSVRAATTSSPGIAGWAQVNGLRGKIVAPEKIRQRVERERCYVDAAVRRLDHVPHRLLA